MSDRLIPIEDAAAWMSVLDRCEVCDVYHLPGYQRAAMPSETGRAVLATVEVDDVVAALPLRLRPVNEIPVVRDSGEFGDDVVDAVSPYGYPGLIYGGAGLSGQATSETAGSVAVGHAIAAALADLLRRHGVVSAFVRQHPLINSTWVFRGHDEFAVDDPGLTVAIDLTESDDAYRSQARRTHLSDIASWSDRAPIFEERDHTALADFGAAYQETMARKGAAGRYMLDDAYFRRLGLELGEGLRLFAATALSVETPESRGDDGGGDETSEVNSPSAWALVLTHGKAAHYHLAATSPDAEHAGLSRWLLDQIRVRLASEGFRTFHLGGGVGASGDSLFTFKSGFSRWRPTFHVAKWIGDRDAYERLCSITGAPVDDDFFPAYR